LTVADWQKMWTLAALSQTEPNDDGPVKLPSVS
jgi:hypothetical protein